MDAHYPTITVRPPASTVKYTVKGCRLIEDVSFSGDETLEIIGVLEDSENSVLGSTIVERSKKNLRAGQLHAQWLLNNQESIPSSWRRSDLIFTGTIYQEGTGEDLIFPVMVWHDDHECWMLDFLSFSFNWHKRTRLVRPIVESAA